MVGWLILFAAIGLVTVLALLALGVAYVFAWWHTRGWRW